MNYATEKSPLANPIKMCELYPQHKDICAELERVICGVIESSSFINGAAVREFEEALARYLGVKYVIACANGTDALQIALMALGLERGDEVLVPAFTYVATAEAAALLGLVPVMYDVNLRSFNTDSHTSFEDIEALVTERTKAIVPVHLFGQCCDMEAVMAIAAKYGLKVVEDTAQALGAKCKVSSDATGAAAELFAGTIGDIGTTSFFPTKNLGCMGDGGALFTNNAELAAKARMIANHGQSVKYHHSIIGCNSRLDTLQAAILNVKLKQLDKYLAARNNAASHYSQLLRAFDPLEKYICTPAESDFSTHTYHQYTLIIKDFHRAAPADAKADECAEREKNTREQLREHLAKKGVPTMVYYPLPLHKQQAFSNFVAEDLALANSEYLAEHVLSLPMHTALTQEQICYIAEAVKEFYGVNR